MAFGPIEFRAGDLHLPELGLWLDPHVPQLGAELVFVSHAHSDHVAAHREVILSAPTARLMQARVPGTRLEHVLDYRRPHQFKCGSRDFELTLFPAGHIFGSAMALITVDGQRLLYTGDFKLRPGLSAEACEPVAADVLIMETTYGRPHYIFPPTDGVMKGVLRFCREALDNDETAVLLGYSLGKSQELLCGLADAGLPLMLHGAVHRLTEIYQQFGQSFPKYERYEAGSARGKVLLCPPNVVNSAMLRNLGKCRTAILTGWAVDPNCRYRYQCDAAFPLSDHADFQDLLAMVKHVEPQKIYTLYGFAAAFAQTLRDLGYQAQSLSEEEQIALPLSGVLGPRSTPARDKPAEHAPAAQREFPKPLHPFADFAETCSRIAGDSRKLEKIRFLAEYLRTLKGDAVALAATWFSGRPFPPSQNKILQVGGAILQEALCDVGALEKSSLYQIYLKHSDLGETAQEMLASRQVTPSLSVEEIDQFFQALHAARGPLAKRPLMTATLARCSAPEAKYLVKIITGDLRIGLKEGLVEEAIAVAFARNAEEVRQANLLLGDVGATARYTAEARLSEASLTPFRPIKFMLASPEETAADILERVSSAHHSEAASHPAPSISAGNTSVVNPPPTVWIEDKYDGIRCQLHKVGTRVALYSRDLKDITSTFLELADAARRMDSDVILDGELVAMRGDDILPFAELQKRLGRRQDDLFMREEVPIKFVAFDLLWMAGQSWLARPLRERRSALQEISPKVSLFRLAQIAQANSVAEIEAAFAAARARDNEGLMIKDPLSAYTPGRRGLAWLKLKKAFATLDCVVVGAEYGHGKRGKVLSDYTFAVRDDQTGELKTIGKAYSGLTDVEIAQLTEHFFKTALRQHGRYFEVAPEIVLEIAFDRLQPSDRHSSGLAMRFPRIVRFRHDKSPAEIDTLATATKMAAKRR